MFYMKKIINFCTFSKTWLDGGGAAIGAVAVIVASSSSSDGGRGETPTNGKFQITQVFQTVVTNSKMTFNYQIGFTWP